VEKERRSFVLFNFKAGKKKGETFHTELGKERKYAKEGKEKGTSPLKT